MNTANRLDMKIITTSFEGLYVLQTINHQDNRGGFQKLFNSEIFQSLGLSVDFSEMYYSVNKKDVLRGMHFQTPPYDHDKMVYVSAGKILDVVVDIRKSSKTYGKCFSIQLDAHSGKYLYIPKGFAHGFLSLEDNTIVNYAQTTCYNQQHDCGISALSCGIKWGVENPIQSTRDLTFPSLTDFETPFE